MNQETKETRFDIQEELVRNSTVFKNFNQEFIVTTVDKIKICLIEHKKALESSIKWRTPLGIFFAFLVCILTADFKNIMGQSPDFWKSLIFFFAISSLMWSLYEIVNSIRVYRNKEGSVKTIIEKLKESSPAQDKEYNKDFESGYNPTINSNKNKNIYG